MSDDQINPFASPDPGDAAQGDFREAAVAASQRLVAANNGRIPKDCSYCLPVDDYDPTLLKRLGRNILLRTVVGVVLLACGAAAAVYFVPAPAHPELLVVGGGAGLLALIGIAVTLSWRYQRRKAVRVLGNRYEELTATSNTKPMFVSIEDADTVERLKVFPEDLGFLTIDSERGVIVVEGLGFRYRVRRQDVVRLEQRFVATTFVTMIHYLIEDEELRMTVQDVRNLLREGIGNRHLTQTIRDALESAKERSVETE